MPARRVAAAATVLIVAWLCGVQVFCGGALIMLLSSVEVVDVQS